MNKNERTLRYREIYELILSIDETKIDKLQTKLDLLHDIRTIDVTGKIADLENELIDFYENVMEEVKSEVEILLDDLRDYVDFSEPIGMHKKQILDEIEFLENLDLENYTEFNELISLNERLKRELKIDLGIILNEKDNEYLANMKKYKEFIILIEIAIKDLEDKRSKSGLCNEEISQLKKYKENKEIWLKAINTYYARLLEKYGKDIKKYINGYINL